MYANEEIYVGSEWCLSKNYGRNYGKFRSCAWNKWTSQTRQKIYKFNSVQMAIVCWRWTMTIMNFKLNTHTQRERGTQAEFLSCAENGLSEHRYTYCITFIVCSPFQRHFLFAPSASVSICPFAYRSLCLTISLVVVLKIYLRIFNSILI